MGTVVKRVLRVSKEFCASLDQWKGTLGELRAERGEAMELNPLMKRRQKLAKPQETLQLLACFRGDPGGGSGDLGRIHPQVVRCYDVSIGVSLV